MANMQGPLVNNFEVPSWAGKPPPGLHLDVTKDGKMVQKLMIDEKKCYFFGRNKHLCDFTIDHASCSRVHAALVWHKHLNRPFIIDLGSTHGTYIGTLRLDSKKPQAVPIDSEIHFGASTRRYVIRERPQTSISVLDDVDDAEIEGNLFGLPETETELDNLTEFNTAHNRRVAQMIDLPDTPKNPLKRKRSSSMRVRFNEEEDIINPEDIDPSIGRFRNLVQTQVIPTKKMRLAEGGILGPNPGLARSGAGSNSLYDDLPVTHDDFQMPTPGTYSIAAKLGLPIPNLAPDIEPMPVLQPVPQPQVVAAHDANAAKEPRKKKYAKEAWPGRRPAPGLLV